MLWKEKTPGRSGRMADRVQDFSFRIACRELPVDHAWALRERIVGILPWLVDEPKAAIHSVHAASSANGWIRPSLESGSMIQLSRRTRLYLRLPAHRIEDARALCGKEFTVSGCTMRIGDFEPRSLAPSSTLFTRSMDAAEVEDEEVFTDIVVGSLEELGVYPSKMLCGLMHGISHGNGCIKARSVLLADLEPRESIRIQQRGLGKNGLLGCGIFLPHKSLDAVYDKSRD
ncbi:MAG: type I-MYXAN CRISPR-associated protein Cas6/Cmx6 [Gammaproteobacteria bacterium]|nr:type I-MYXAN CRISPR-associated protein Cas6/Cmx6 [Gammaproteobacteria bacterium]MYD75664.1 type I-MYXAN CRISPR-associated protein Cas6/Cmx6 [Gammaproteobacteria bacterium]MYJ51877.1 type I-MYXAN CRISPR-associated protein Cas6/Cmx6 [Gammaproteobacteria bacterium]